MAIVIREKQSPYYTAHWHDMHGRKHSKATRHRDYARALSEANKLEAEEHFHNQASARIIDFMAANGLSPDGCYDHFTHKAHMKRDRFKQLCREAQITFKTSKEWIDKKRTNKRTKRHRWKGKLMLLEEIMNAEGCTLAITTVQARLKAGKDIKQAIAQ